MSTASSIQLGQRIVSADEVANRVRKDLCPGVTYTILWRDAGTVAGVMWVNAGKAVSEHIHEDAIHHVWLVDGRALVDGRVLERGSYWHVPAGVVHDVEGLAPYGCELFYLYEPTAP